MAKVTQSTWSWSSLLSTQSIFIPTNGTHVCTFQAPKNAKLVGNCRTAGLERVTCMLCKHRAHATITFHCDPAHHCQKSAHLCETGNPLSQLDGLLPVRLSIPHSQWGLRRYSCCNSGTASLHHAWGNEQGWEERENESLKTTHFCYSLEGSFVGCTIQK